MATCAIRKQHPLLFLDAVFHVAASAINLFVQLFRITFEIRHDISRVFLAQMIVAARQSFRLHDDLSRMFPCSRLVLVFPKQAKRLTRTGIHEKHLRCKNDLLRQLLQHGIRRVTENVFVAVTITVGKQFRTIHRCRLKIPHNALWESVFP